MAWYSEFNQEFRGLVERLELPDTTVEINCECDSEKRCGFSELPPVRIHYRYISAHVFRYGVWNAIYRTGTIERPDLRKFYDLPVQTPTEEPAP